VGVAPLLEPAPKGGGHTISHRHTNQGIGSYTHPTFKQRGAEKPCGEWAFDSAS
jgi:hypothetical protein